MHLLPYPVGCHFFFLYKKVKFVMITRYKFCTPRICFSNSNSVSQGYFIFCFQFARLIEYVVSQRVINSQW